VTFGVSIVSGTWNRIALLKSMMQSVRRYMHFGIPIEFIICDAGSTDGTLEWLRGQSDVIVIADGERKGAISAFTRSAYHAQYDTVLLVNDDVLFQDYSILAALAYLMEHPHCGAVAFADDRPALSKPPGYGVQTMTVTSLEGKPISIPYAQVGLYRRWLGDLCGWWGANDPLFKSHTYGGDNYLTARILEYGYSVDAVQGVRVKDIIAQDGLRDHNTRLDSGPSGYYARFPSPPQIKDHPLVSNPQIDAGMRVLYLPIFESGTYPHHRQMKRGLREALQAKGPLVEVDYLNEDYDLVALVKAWQPHLLMTQCQRDLIDLTAARREQPDMLVLNWNGDVYLDALISSDTLVWLKTNVDAQLCVNGAALPVYAEHEIPAAYWQCAYEPVEGNVFVSPENAPDIVFMGSAYSEKRHELARVLTDLPYKVHLVGTGWVNYPEHNAGNTTYQFEISNAIRRAAKIEVGDNQYERDTGFVSNRIFDCLAAGGAILLHQRIEQLGEFTGLEAGVHYIEWRDYDDLQSKIAYYLNPKHAAKRDKIVKCAYDYVKAQHSFSARVRQLFDEVLPRIL
jgi:glycosyltransferase involved in cell wall biosynthesis